MKLRFFMSQHRRNSARGIMIGKKWIYLERYTFHRENVVCLKTQERSWEKHSPQTVWATQKARDPETWDGQFLWAG